MREVISLQEAIDELFRIAVLESKATSTLRLQKLADYCVEQLAARSLPDAETEVQIPGAGRDKKWDVAWQYGGKQRLGISLKSILRNLGGTVPNRIDDLIGETANVQLHSPEIAIGYIMVFNVQDDRVSPQYDSTWSELMRNRLVSLSGREAPSWTTGMIEDFVLIEVNFESSPEVVSVSQPLEDFFDRIVDQVVKRNPGILQVSRDSAAY